MKFDIIIKKIYLKLFFSKIVACIVQLINNLALYNPFLYFYIFYIVMSFVSLVLIHQLICFVSQIFNINFMFNTFFCF